MNRLIMNLKNHLIPLILFLVLTVSCSPTKTLEPQDMLSKAPEIVTLTPIATRIPTVTPTYTPVPSPTPTSLPSILPGDWASDKETHIVNPDTMFPIVGSVYDAHRRTIDLEYHGIKLAVVLDQEIDLQDPNGLRELIAGQLDQQEEMKDQLEEIIIQLPENERNKAIVIIDGSDLTQISQIAIRDKLPISKRYVYEDGQLRELSKEEEPHLMPPLSAPDHRFVRTDTGEQVMLRGGHIVNTVFAPRKVYVTQIEGIFKGLRDIGANWVVFQWNSGFLDSSTYRAKILEVFRIAKYKYGFWVQIDLKSRGLVDPNDPYLTPNLDRLDNQVIEDWRKLLSDPETVFWIGRTVDIFTIVNEPNNPPNETQTSFFDPLLLQACDAIRSSLNNPNAICNLSAGRWGWSGDAAELLNIPRPETFKETTINVHPYRLDISKDTWPDIRDYAQNLQQHGWNVSVGEFGWRDVAMNPEYIKEGLKFFEDNKISYAWFGTAGGYNTDYLNNPNADSGDAADLFMDYEGKELSPTGEFMKTFWSQYQDQ